MEIQIGIGNQNIEISHAEKILFPKIGLSKGDVAIYYQKISRWLLHHIHDRALTLERYPEGIEEKGFFQQEAADHFDETIQRKSIPRKNGTALDRVVCTQGPGLVNLANLGVVTLHMWLSRFDKPAYPDRMLFDFDPSGDNFSLVRFGAMRLREILEQLDLQPFVMTTGSRGCHVVVPLDGVSDFETVRRFATDVVSILACRYDQQLTVEQRRNKRKGRLYLDVLRNGYGQTGVAPYSLRPVEEAAVATPLDWEEFSELQDDARKYTINNIFRRLGQKGDPWRKIRLHARSLKGPQKKLEYMLRE